MEGSTAFRVQTYFFIRWLVQDANEPGIAGIHNQLLLSNYKHT